MTAIDPHAPEDQREAIAFLNAPETYGVSSVERHETHGAIVFLAGERAYKLKRAVRYAYMDFSTRERRRELCFAELEINRRTAPELYLEVRAIRRGVNGALRFDAGDANTRDAVDWVLVMRRFDQAGLFEQMRRADRLTADHIRALAAEVAGFHLRAEPAPRYGGRAGIDDVLDTALKVIEGMAGRAFAATKVDRLARLVWLALEQLAPLLDRRRDLGLVRRCHGDLHLNNICLIDGRPVLFDAIEFNDSFACIDVLYDLAFLLMDLDRHGRRDFANLVVNRYLEVTQDYEGLAALPLFLSCRAAIRAHIAVTMADAVADRGLAAGKVAEGQALLDAAIGCLEPPPPRMLVIGGLSGTGKTTVARALAPMVGGAPGAVILRSDVTRKRLMGVAETDRLPPAGYAAEMTEKVFATLAADAARVLAAGNTVIMDAVYGEPLQRAAIREVAARASAPFEGLWLEAPAGVLEARVAARRGDASDATPEVVRDQRRRIAAPAEWRRIDAERSPAAVAEDILRHIDPPGVRAG